MVTARRDEEQMVQELSKAIREGNKENAEELARQLAEKKAVIDMMYEPPDDSRDKIISIKVHIENKERTTIRPLEWNVKVSTKISQLKRLLHKEYRFPESYQRWIVRDRIPADSASLSSCGVAEDGYTVFVYIMSRKPRSVHPGLEEEHTLEITGTGPAERSGPMTMPAGTAVSPQAVGGASRDLPYATMPTMGVGDGGGAASMDGAGVSSMETATGGVVEHQMQIGWNCPKCTLVNEPQNRQCNACNGDRPASYVVPPAYRDLAEVRSTTSSSSNDTIRTEDSTLESQQPHGHHQPQRPQEQPHSQRPQDHYLPQRPQEQLHSQRPQDHYLPQRPQEQLHSQRPQEQPQRPNDLNRPYRAEDQYHSQRPQDHFQPQRPHQTQRPQRPTEHETTAPIPGAAEKLLVYNPEKMTYEYK